MDLATGRPIGEPLIGGDFLVLSVALSPDGRVLAAGTDAEVRFWDVATRQPIGEPLTGTRGLRAMAFSRDGGTLVTIASETLKSLVGPTRTTMLTRDLRYTVDPAEDLCRWAAGAFTADQWSRYVPPGPTPRQLCP